MKKLFKIVALSSLVIIVVLLTKCHCGNMEPTPIEPIKTPSAIYYNLETIDLDIKDQASLSFAFNGKKLMLDEKSGLYISEDLIVYRTKEGNYKATIIGPGGIESALEIKSGNNLTKEISIKTTSEIFPYKDELGPEWPGMYNIGNTCFANSLYKLLARSSIFDEVINQDKPKQIHTFLRNIINGIRLGKRSTLHEEAVNRMISKIFLDQLTLQSGAAWNDRKQNDPDKMLKSTINCIFPGGSQQIIPPENVEVAITAMNAKPSHGHITEFSKATGESTGVVVYYPCSLVSFIGSELREECLDFKDATIGYLFTTPRNLFLATTDLGALPETIQIPIWDYKTKKRTAVKTYKVGGACVHSGSSVTSGHYVAYIHFNKAGWFKHSDSQVNIISTLPSFNNTDMITLAMYELQE